jgi:pteridine reductase
MSDLPVGGAGGSTKPPRNRVALVTGAGQRLGRELALGLGRAGYDVAVHFRSRRENAEETGRLLGKGGTKAELFEADLSRGDSPLSLVEKVLSSFSRLDVLVHAASPWITKPIADMTLEDWDATFDAGPRAAFFLAQAATPALRASSGAILLMSDVAAVKAWPSHVPHCAAKAAINSLVMNLAVALGPEIRVNAIAPGVVLPPDAMSADVIAKLVAKTPLQRRVALQDVVGMAVAILGNRSMTGQVVSVDAGRSIKGD